MRTASGLTYEIMHGGDQAIVACTCWTEATPVITNLDTHWLRRLAQEHTLVLTNHRGLAGSAGRADFASALLGLRDVVDELGAPVILLGGCEAAVVPLALAARHPDRVRALIVVNGTARRAADAEYAGGSVGGLWSDTTPGHNASSLRLPQARQSAASAARSWPTYMNGVGTRRHTRRSSPHAPTLCAPTRLPEPCTQR